LISQSSNPETSTTEHIHQFGINDGVGFNPSDFAPYIIQKESEVIEMVVTDEMMQGNVQSPVQPKAPHVVTSDMTIYDYWSDRERWWKRYLVPGVKECEWDLIVDEPVTNLYCMSFFNEQFCNEIIEAAERVNRWTYDRHYYYPTTDMLLTELNFDDIYYDLLKTFVMPAAIHLYMLDGEGWSNMNAENFIAKYTDKGQHQLSIHHDSSEITALVNLSCPDKDYEGGGTWFVKQRALYRPRQGSLSLHPGNITHKHGARPVTRGKRYVIVSFMNRP
jgi:hypothetical protein